MKVNIADLHPTQHVLSEKRSYKISRCFISRQEIIEVDPISSCIWNYLLITDGHHRGLSGFLLGQDDFAEG